jgi:ubiquinone/menaquinone biosynthesis C-methylase UbiE
MDRTLEPEIMADPEQVLAYAQADFATSNQLFVDQLLVDFPHMHGNALDIGCGPADVLIRLAKRCPELRVTAIDGSAAMIKAARQAVRAAQLEPQITLLQGHIPGLPLEAHSYDALLSKDLLHHLPQPMVLWSEVRRLARPGAALFMMDLFRRATPAEARAIVESVAANEHPLLKADFYNSLCAAFTITEVQDQLRAAGLNLAVTQISARHMLIKGVV